MKLKKSKEPLAIELIPIYLSKKAFAEKKEVVKDLIARILVSAHYEEQKAKPGLILTDQQLK